MSDEVITKKILLIDDDPVLTKLAESRLKVGGYSVGVTNDAAEGLERALKEKPDLIVLDVMMPMINGYNFCRLLKTQDDHKEIPIIFLTSRDDAKDVEIGKEVGANAYLTKPVDIEDLIKTIEELLSPVE